LFFFIRVRVQVHTLPPACGHGRDKRLAPFIKRKGPHDHDSPCVPPNLDSTFNLWCRTSAGTMDEVSCEAGLPSEREGHLPSHSHVKEEYFSASSSSENEKTKIGADVEVALVDQAENDEGLTGGSHTINTDDPFPMDPHLSVEERQFTLRAVLVGYALGAVIAASNVYLGLKTGFTFGAGLFGSIFGFAILKPFSTSAPSYLGGGYLALKKTTWSKPLQASPGRSGYFSLLAFPRRTNPVFSTPPPRKISANSSRLRSAVPFLDLDFRSRCASFTSSNSS